MITDPLLCCVPAAGFWPTTVPAAAGSSTSSRATAKPAPWSEDWALSNADPITFGTVTGFGPFETLTRTVEPSISSVPAFGAVASTVLTGWSELTETTLAFSPALTRSETAWSLLWPTTSGTLVFGGPVETTIVTKLPFSVRSPGCGSCSETRPTFTSAFGSRCTSSLRPASRMFVTASCSVEALDVGHGDRLGGAELILQRLVGEPAADERAARPAATASSHGQIVRLRGGSSYS